MAGYTSKNIWAVQIGPDGVNKNINLYGYGKWVDIISVGGVLNMIKIFKELIKIKNQNE